MSQRGQLPGTMLKVNEAHFEIIIFKQRVSRQLHSVTFMMFFFFKI